MPAVLDQPLPILARVPALGDAPPPLPLRSASPLVPIRHTDAPLASQLWSSLEAADAPTVRRLLLDRLAKIWGAQQVVLGWRRHAAGRWLCAVSGQATLDPRTELGRAYAAALAETCLSKTTRHWSADHRSAAVPLSYRQLAGLAGAGSISGIPLYQEDQSPTTALLILDHSGGPELLGRDDAVREIAAALSGLTRLCDEATPPKLFAFLRHAFHLLAARRGLSTFIGIAVMTVIGMIPVADRVTCSTTLEPSLRRFVGAPFDGKLEKAVVKVGDSVSEGQTIAILDQRPLEIELSVLEAEFEEAAKRRDAARAKGQASLTQLAELEVAQIERKIDQARHHLQQLTVTSPLTGVVVRGELQRVEGAPLTRGQNLFEIAPLSPLVAELAVPEDEVRLLAAGQTTIIRPVALPGQSLRGTIGQVHPRAEVRDGRTVFIAEVILTNEDGRLKPGMQAQAIVMSSRQPLAWTLIRRPWARFTRWMWW